MKGLIITNKGTEDISKKEIKELINSDAEIKETVCIFTINSLNDLCRLSYLGQSFIKVLYLLDIFNIDANFKQNLKKIIKKNVKTFAKFIKKNHTFKVKCAKIDSDAISSEIEDIAGSVIDYKVDLENPDLILYIYIFKDICYIGIDFSGFDLSKRDYKIFNFPVSLKGNIAYSLIRISGYNKKEKILDPFCSSGEIVIESALFASGMSPHYYKKDSFLFNKYLKFDFNKVDKKIDLKNKQIYALDSQFRNVRAAQKNSKIAGVNKIINFSRQETEWLDIKFKKEEIDKIVTGIRFSKYNNITKLLKEFFYQCSYILKKKGKIVIVTNNKELLKTGFDIIEEREVWQGKEKLYVLVYNKFL